MSFKNIATQRYSVRNYSSKPIDEQILISVLEAAAIAPSAVNFQPWKMIVVTDQAILKQVQETYPRD